MQSAASLRAELNVGSAPSLDAKPGIKNFLILMFELRGMWASRFDYSDELLAT